MADSTRQPRTALSTKKPKIATKILTAALDAAEGRIAAAQRAAGETGAPLPYPWSSDGGSFVPTVGRAATAGVKGETVPAPNA
jgi:hypothetical protein